MVAKASNRAPCRRALTKRVPKLLLMPIEPGLSARTLVAGDYGAQVRRSQAATGAAAMTEPAGVAKPRSPW